MFFKFMEDLDVINVMFKYKTKGKQLKKSMNFIFLFSYNLIIIIFYLIHYDY